MPKKTTTPLGYLMDLLHIQGTQLARMIHVDRTIVSRWKNGHIPLNDSSDYFDDAVDAIVTINDERSHQTLQRFFSSLSGQTVEHDGQLRRQVVQWLLSEDFEKHFSTRDEANSLYSAGFHVYKGPRGKVDAHNYLLQMFQKEVEQTGSERIWGYDAGSGMDGRKQSDVVRIQNSFQKTLQQGGEALFMFCLNRPDEQIFALYKDWLPAFLHANTQAYYTYDVLHHYYQYMYNIQGKMSLVGSCQDGVKSNLYTAVYDDPMTVQESDTYLNHMLDTMEPLFSRLNHGNMCLDFSNATIAGYFKSDNPQYILQENFPLLNFSRETLEQIVLAMDLSEHESDLLLDFCRSCSSRSERMFADHTHTRMVLSLEHLEHLKQQRAMPVPSFSTLLKREVYIPSRFLLQETVRFLEEALQMPSMEIAIRPQGTDAFLTDTTTWIKEGNLLYIVPMADSSTRLLSTEFTSVHAMYNSAEAYWDTLPYECKQPSYITEQLELLQ